MLLTCTASSTVHLQKVTSTTQGQQLAHLDADKLHFPTMGSAQVAMGWQPQQLWASVPLGEELPLNIQTKPLLFEFFPLS